MWWFALVGVIGLLLGNMLAGPAVTRVQRWRADRLRRSVRVACGLRVIAGVAPGLTPRWRSGTARLVSGRLEFRPAARWRPRISVPVAEVSRLHQRQVVGPEAVLVPATSRVIEVRTQGATLEWAVREDQLLWAVDQFRRPAQLGAAA